MSQISFYAAYEPLAERVERFLNTQQTMTVAKRMQESSAIDQETNKVFTDKLKDEMLGQHIDMMA